MPVLTSVFATAKGLRETRVAAVNNGVASVVIPCSKHSTHVVEVIAGYTDGVTSKTLTLTQGTITKSYTVTGNDGLIDMLDPDFTAGTDITVSLPASGAANVIGYLIVIFVRR